MKRNQGKGSTWGGGESPPVGRKGEVESSKEKRTRLSKPKKGDLSKKGDLLGKIHPQDRGWEREKGRREPPEKDGPPKLGGKREKFSREGGGLEKKRCGLPAGEKKKTPLEESREGEKVFFLFQQVGG